MELYICTIDSLVDLPGQQLIGKSRREKMLRYVRVEDKARCLAAGLLLRAAFGECEDSMRIGSAGKPYLPDGGYFNISHSGRYVILGVANDEIGVDVEQIAPFDERLAQRCFTSEELTWLHTQDSQNRFYRLWTAKESVMKATGLGFNLPPESFCVLPMEEGVHIIDGRNWYLRWTELPGHMVCVAYTQAQPMRTIFLERELLIAEYE